MTGKMSLCLNAPPLRLPSYPAVVGQRLVASEPLGLTLQRLHRLPLHRHLQASESQGARGGEIMRCNAFFPVCLLSPLFRMKLSAVHLSYHTYVDLADLVFECAALLEPLPQQGVHVDSRGRLHRLHVPKHTP
jgi:hypothetical protein